MRTFLNKALETLLKLNGDIISKCTNRIKSSDEVLACLAQHHKAVIVDGELVEGFEHGTYIILFPQIDKSTIFIHYLGSSTIITCDISGNIKVPASFHSDFVFSHMETEDGITTAHYRLLRYVNSDVVDVDLAVA